MTGSVLLVEDEENLASLVRAYLEQEGYRVISVTSGAEALRAVEVEPVRIVVLDLNLPDMDGLDVCRQIRTRSSVPVVMLTARDEETDRVAGLETGADDYIGKPFSPRELVARMKAVLRRTEQHPRMTCSYSATSSCVAAPARSTWPPSRSSCARRSSTCSRT